MNNYPVTSMWVLLIAWCQAFLMLAFFYYVPTIYAFGKKVVFMRYVLIAMSIVSILFGGFVLLDIVLPSPVKVETVK